MKKQVIGLTMALAMTACLATAASAKDQKFVGISFPSTLIDRWPKEAEYMKEGLEALGYRAEIQYADEDDNKQYQQCDNFISQGADLLVVCAVDTASATQIVEAAHAEGVQVVSYCRVIENCAPDAYTGEDNPMCGVLQGQYVVDHVDSGNVIVVGGSPIDNNGRMYHDTAVETIQPLVDDGSYNIVADQWAKNWDGSIAMEIVENALTLCDNDVQAVICPNDIEAGGAIEALAAQGLAGKVVVTGGDGELAAVKRILDGTQTMTIFKDSKKIADASVVLLDSMLKGEEPAFDGTVNTGTDDIPAVLVDMTVVDKDNVREVFIDGGIYTEEEVNQ